MKKISRRTFLIGGLASCGITTTAISQEFGERSPHERLRSKETVKKIRKHKPREADKVKITVIVDNYTDTFLQDSSIVKRPRIPPPNGLLGEPGFSCLIEVSSGIEKHAILFDGGISDTCLFNNMNRLGIKPQDIEAVVLSHGHYDHFGGIYGFFKKTKRTIPFIVHPDAFLERRYNRNAFFKTDMTSLDEEPLKAHGANIRKRKSASTIASGLILVSGNVKRRTTFEKGFPEMEAKIDNHWVTDPFNDDQGLSINLKDRGLIVIGGCSHAGIINTIYHCREISGIEKIHAVVGGFHLSGPKFDPVVGPTIEKMKELNPDYVAPMHCTGWKTINRFAKEMPEKFLLGCVGTTYIFS